MPKKRMDPQQHLIELLEKLIVIHLHTLGTPQGTAARLLGKSKVWVNATLRGVPKPRKEKS